ncbi:Phthiocerol synthesis polyketide synthase type I PpsC [Alphaproteobacteria bacterium SO-S41]|nr:Phthiocerol synthesis polyketide synthase type I PpsC [Alphaproteobacteria bacterium SO-S41]
MRAVVSSPDGPILRDVAAPTPGPDDILVRIRAAALNRADLFMLKGAAHGKVGGAGLSLGLEWAGEIVEVGANVERWKTGDRVMAAGGSGYSEYAVAHQRRVYAMPDRLSFTEAAGLPVALQTMHDAIVTNGKLQPGQSVLIQGASTGVGLMGLQIAKFLGAGLVIGSSTTAERRARLAEFGADLAIDTRDPSWVASVTEATGGKGVDLVIDQVAGPLMNANLHATRIGGRIVNVGRLGGNTGEFNFDLHALRRITYVGVTFRTRSAAEVEAVMAATSTALGTALADGKLNLPVDHTYPLGDFAAAFARMAANQHFGKIVLTLD